MGYRIEYGPQIGNPILRTGSNGRLRTMIAAAFLVFSLVVRVMWQEGTEVLQSILLPVDLTVTEQAFSVMLSDLRGGEPVADAVTVFCRTIIDGAS